MASLAVARIIDRRRRLESDDSQFHLRVGVSLAWLRPSHTKSQSMPHSILALKWLTPESNDKCRNGVEPTSTRMDLTVYM